MLHNYVIFILRPVSFFVMNFAVVFSCVYFISLINIEENSLGDARVFVRIDRIDVVWI